MSNLAVGYATRVDSGREHRSDGLLKHLGMADLSTVRATGNRTDTLHAGKGTEMLLVSGTPPFGLIQVLDRDVGPPSGWLDLVIGANNISLQTHGGVVSMPQGSASDLWDTVPADGNRQSLSVTAWTQYDAPGLQPLTMNLRAAARVRCDWFYQYTPPAPGITYFKPYIDGSTQLDVPDAQYGVGNSSVAVGFGIFNNVAAGAHTVKLCFTPTQTGTFYRESWYARFSVTASYA